MNLIKKSMHATGKRAPEQSLEQCLATLGHPELCCSFGEQLLQKGQAADALGFFKKAVALDSSSVHGWFGQGMAHTNMGEYAGSVEYFRKATELDPTLAIAHHNLGRSLHEIGQADLAYQSFKKSIDLGFMATWKNVAVAVPGFPSATNQSILRDRREWADELVKSVEKTRGRHSITRDSQKGTLRVGYVSAFFHKDNWMKPVWGLIGQHDRDSFEIHLFSDRTKITPTIKNILEPGDRFHDISSLSNEEAAKLIVDLNIDILVDLNGYSYPNRFPVFLERPAPMVIGWFNLYATTGFSCFDYLVGDDCVIPPDEEVYYTEKIARVAGSYLTFSVAYDVPDLVEPPCIKNGFTTFGSLISQYKITESVIDTWTEILRETPQSRLLIRNASLGKSSNKKYLLSQFVNRGVARERISLEGPAPHYEFLRTYNRIDIALDAFPYNGGTTTTEAIWQGLPVVSYWGDRWVSRTSATLLRSAGMEEMVAKDVSAYVRLAVDLASDPEKLKTMRQNMRDKLRGSKACDTVAFARSMEKLYRELWEK